jgi:hypothetical protein
MKLKIADSVPCSETLLVAPHFQNALRGEWSGTTISGRNWKVHRGDALTVLARLPDQSVHCIVTSPPYFWLRDYGVKGQIGLEETVSGYIDSICDVMDQAKRVLRSDGLLSLRMLI